MKRKINIWITLMCMLIFSSCSSGNEEIKEVEKEKAVQIAVVKSRDGDRNRAIEELLKTKTESGKFGYKMMEVSELTPEEIEDGKYEIIIFTHKEHKDFLLDIKDKFKNQKFAVIDDVVLGSNVSSYVFNENEGAFLLGRIAGAMTNGQMGFIGGKEIKIISNEALGFWKGIESLKKQGINEQDSTKYLNDFGDINGAYSAAEEIYEGKSGILFSRCHGASLGIYTYVSESNEMGRKIFIMGDKIEGDEYKGKFKGVFLGDYSKNFNVIIEKIIHDIKRDEHIEGDVFEFGVFEGGIYIDDNVRKILPQSVIDSLDEAIEKIKSGDIILHNEFQ